MDEHNGVNRRGGDDFEQFARIERRNEEFSAYRPAQSDHWCSCFISHSQKDTPFVRYLTQRLRGEQVRVWCAPEDLSGGQKLCDQIAAAINSSDKVLVVLSEYSMDSEWVWSEIHTAMQREARENVQILFPIRLVDFETVKKWKCRYGEGPGDLAAALREYFIPDFSDRQDPDRLELAFSKLISDLRGPLA